MRAARAKRRALRWARYVGRMPTRAGAAKRGGIYLGHARSYSGYMYAGRSYPTGVRVPWPPLAYGLPIPQRQQF